MLSVTLIEPDAPVFKIATVDPTVFPTTDTADAEDVSVVLIDSPPSI